jgi:hypothetical protein
VNRIVGRFKRREREKEVEIKQQKRDKADRYTERGLARIGGRKPI